jgi:mannosyltransferase
VRLAALALLTAAGLAVRLSVVHQSLFADELSTWWIVSSHDFGGVLSAVHSDAEISPPLSFVAGWLGTRIDLTGEMLRLPSLIAGTLTIPVVYLLGTRTVGRMAGMVAAAVTALSPFMIYYSAEARGYALLMFFVALSTLAMLQAVDRDGSRWWVAYALASAAAVYTHYTCVFVLGAQLAWLWWAHPEARRPSLIANAAAAVAFLPWIDGLLKDFSSPTTDILSALQPFEPWYIQLSIEHWAVGYPYSIVPLDRLPGPIGLVLMGAALACIALGLLRTRAADLLRAERERRRRIVLVLALTAATAAAGAVFSLLGGTHIISTRNLAASWPGFALVLGLLAASAGPRLRYAAAALLVGGFAVAAVKMLDSDYSRPQYEDAVAFVDERSEPGSVVIDETATRSAGPLSNIDPYLDGRYRTFRSRTAEDPTAPLFGRHVVTTAEASRKAVAAAKGRSIFLVTHAQDEAGRRPMPGYRTAARREYPGIERVVVRMYERP